MIREAIEIASQFCALALFWCMIFVVAMLYIGAIQ
jgi:hypothetical protein